MGKISPRRAIASDWGRGSSFRQDNRLRGRTFETIVKQENSEQKVIVFFRDEKCSILINLLPMAG